MVETITPAGCGSRHRHRAALALFALGAGLAAAGLGALLGLAGSALDPAWTLPALAVLALAVAAREAGLVRLPIPELRRQVPERWRREWPLPAWSLGYGAGLGVGALTHQPVGTFWVAAAGALALGEPPISAVCLLPFGLGRALMVALPARRGRDPAAAVGRLAARRRVLGPANAAALMALAALAGGAPALAQSGGSSGHYDPAVWGNVVASSEAEAGASAVVLRAPGRPEVRIPGAGSPSVDADLLAYADTAGVRVVRWTTGEELARLPGRVGRPALDWPRVAVVRESRGGSRLELVNLVTGARRTVARARPGEDLGRPALRGGLLAWHHSSGRRSVVLLRPARRAGSTTVVASSATAVHVNPSLAAGHIAWVESRGDVSYLRLRRVHGVRVRTLATLGGRDRILWTTALSPSRVYVTRWSLRTGRAVLISRRWRPAR
jgi:hypothetical protein